MKKNIFFLLIFLFISSFLVSCSKDLKIEDKTMIDNKVMIKDEVMVGSGKWTKEEMESMVEDESIVINESMMGTGERVKENTMKDSKSGVYANYSSETVKNATGNIVLFFHANWCPTCVSLDKDISLNIVPSDLTILKVDYDNSDDLKTKYGVLTQTTFVQVDNKGNMIKKWISARNLDDIISKIK